MRERPRSEYMAPIIHREDALSSSKHQIRRLSLAGIREEATETRLPCNSVTNRPPWDLPSRGTAPKNAKTVGQDLRYCVAAEDTK